jgi:hypothetical protein
MGLICPGNEGNLAWKVGMFGHKSRSLKHYCAWH